MSQIDDIKNQIDFVDLVSETVKLRRTGKNYIGFCPFHANTRTPAFVVFPDSGTWKCFGQCAEGGDMFNFLMKRDHIDFPEALQKLADRAGIKLERIASENPEKEEQKTRLYALMESAAAFYHNNLLHHPAGKQALTYLEKRGLTIETIEKFQLGYAPDLWDSLLQHLMSEGYNRQELVDTGMVSEKRDEKGDVIEEGRIYDRFRNRIMIPIHDSSSHIIAFGARILNPNDVPKFLNSPQTVLFDKGKTLFGLNRAKAAIREKNKAVIVEGYMDVIVLHQAGFTNTVSPMGTALGEFQVRLLTRQSKNLILALDADAAGDSATIKGIDVIREAVKNEEPNLSEVIENQSLIRHEKKLHADIRITRIPEGMDPDEVVLRAPEEWQAILDNAKPIVIYKMETAAEGRDLDDAKTKSEIAQEVMPLIAEVPNAIERETYRQQLARFLQIDVALLPYSLGVTKAKPNRRHELPERQPMQEKPQLVFDPKVSLYDKETVVFKYLYHFYNTPGSLSKIDRTFRQYQLHPVNAADFEEPTIQPIVRSFFEGINQDDELDTHSYIRQNISPTIHEELEKRLKIDFIETLRFAELDRNLTFSLATMRVEKIILSYNELQSLLRDQLLEDETADEYETLLTDILLERGKYEKLLKGLIPVFK